MIPGGPPALLSGDKRKVLPLPRTDDILASFKGKRHFLVMDMCHGFNQIEIEEEACPKTSFATPDCQRQYR